MASTPLGHDDCGGRYGERQARQGSSGLITSNVLYRVFKIRAGTDSIGTAFTVDYESRQYLVTAKHVVKQLAPPYAVALYLDNDWGMLSLELTGMSSDADVAVFRPAIRLSPGFPMPPTSAGLMYGQDVYFLGYPYNLESMGATGENRPLPLVKKGCLSAMLKDGRHGYFLLDGHNNPGFSGGPAIFSHPSKPTEYNVFGIVSGYLPGYGEARIGGAPEGFDLALNTGIMRCADIAYAIDEIKSNPNGLELDAPV